MKIAKPFYETIPDKKQDLQGAAYLGLCEGVHAAIKQNKEDFIPHFIYLYVRQCVLE